MVYLKTQESVDLASALAAHLAEVLLPSWAIDLVVPIPLSATRLRMRGFNQAELLAQAFAQLVQLPIAIKALMRIRDTKFQRTLGRADRKQNVRQAFRADGRSFAGMKILIVDDIFVTGATINSASRAIKKAGGHSVFAITVARSLLNTPA
ncbi:MAG: ComF family protein [Anaerolineales bacterium]|nr:MAG: ComF family protein [Anaerolineales bacterium]